MPKTNYSIFQHYFQISKENNYEILQKRFTPFTVAIAVREEVDGASSYTAAMAFPNFAKFLG